MPSLPDEHFALRILVSLPPTYPSSSPPQLQLLSKYIGNFGADAGLFGAVLRTYISMNGIEWTPDTVCVFDGLQSVIERCMAWYGEKLSADEASKVLRMEEKTVENTAPIKENNGTKGATPRDISSLDTPAGVEMYVAEPIVDRKSAFVGRACRISDTTQASTFTSLQDLFSNHFPLLLGAFYTFNVESG